MLILDYPNKFYDWKDGSGFENHDKIKAKYAEADIFMVIWFKNDLYFIVNDWNGKS